MAANPAAAYAAGMSQAAAHATAHGCCFSQVQLALRMAWLEIPQKVLFVAHVPTLRLPACPPLCAGQVPLVVGERLVLAWLQRRGAMPRLLIRRAVTLVRAWMF